jgi:ribosome-interacting GTPase 1
VTQIADSCPGVDPLIRQDEPHRSPLGPHGHLDRLIESDADDPGDAPIRRGQLVEIPGLIQGASDGRGRGRALLSVLRGADGITFCQDVRAPVGELLTVLREVELAGISSPSVLGATKVDEASPDTLDRLRAAVPDLRVIGVTVLDEGSLEAFGDLVWGLTRLRTVWTRRPGSEETDPQPMRAGQTVADVVAALHGELGAECRGAHVWGPWATFPGQRVGRDHALEDGDMVEIIT